MRIKNEILLSNIQDNSLSGSMWDFFEYDVGRGIFLYARLGFREAGGALWSYRSYPPIDQQLFREMQVVTEEV